MAEKTQVETVTIATQTPRPPSPPAPAPATVRQDILRPPPGFGGFVGEDSDLAPQSLGQRSVQDRQRVPVIVPEVEPPAEAPSPPAEEFVTPDPTSPNDGITPE